MEKEFYTTIYDSKAVTSMWMVQKKATLTKDNLILRKTGPRYWHFILLLFLVGWLPLLIWMIIGQASKGKETKIPLKSLKKIEVDHPKYTLVYRVKLTDKDDQEYYFIPRKSYWQVWAGKEFVENFVRDLKKST